MEEPEVGPLVLAHVLVPSYIPNSIPQCLHLQGDFPAPTFRDSPGPLPLEFSTSFESGYEANVE